MGMFSLLSDVVSIAVAPIQVATSVASAVVKPIADVTKEVVEEVEDLFK